MKIIILIELSFTLTLFLLFFLISYIYSSVFFLSVFHITLYFCFSVLYISDQFFKLFSARIIYSFRFSFFFNNLLLFHQDNNNVHLLTCFLLLLLLLVCIRVNKYQPSTIKLRFLYFLFLSFSFFPLSMLHKQSHSFHGFCKMNHKKKQKSEFFMFDLTLSSFPTSSHSLNARLLLFYLSHTQHLRSAFRGTEITKTLIHASVDFFLSTFL